MSNEQVTNPGSQFASRHSPVIMLAVLLIAAFFRFYQLPSLPPGLNFDEAGNGVAALDILHGTPKIWWQIGGGKEPLWPYLVAAGTAILGNTPLTLRLLAAWTGWLTVAAVYPLVRIMFKDRHAHLIGLFTMLGLALSEWHLHFSRLGFRAVLLPLLSALGFYFFWRALANVWDTAGRWWRWQWLLAALFIALAIYAYLAARLLPLVLLLFFGLNWLLYRLSLWWSKPTSPDQQPTGYALPLIHRTLSNLLYLLAGLLLFLAPLMVYFAFNPADFVARSATVSIFSPQWNQGDLPGTAGRTLSLTLGTFLGLQGDANPLVNLPRQPALPPLLAIFFLFGVGTSLYHIVLPGLPAALRPSFAPSKLTGAPQHLFLLCWWGVMLLPAILAPEGAPHHLRLMGTLVPSYILVAVGLVAATNLIARLLFHILRTIYRVPNAVRPAYLLAVACYLMLGLQTYSNYFEEWPASADFTLPFDLYATELAADIAQAPAEVIYILPMDIRAGAEARHYTLDYLLDSNQAAYIYIPVDERNAEKLLSQAAANHTKLRVVRWQADKHSQADAKEIVSYLLETTASPAGVQSFPVYNIQTYLVSNQRQTFMLPAINRPITTNFEGLLRVEAAYLPTTASPGGWLPVALSLSPLAQMGVDYKASLRLSTPAGQRVAQKDRLLLHTYHQGTSLWPPETVNEYYLLSIPPETSPGPHTVAVVIYHPHTLAPLVASGIVELPLGTVRIQ